MHLPPGEEDVTEGMEEGQDELQQAQPAETSEDRQIPSSEPLRVQERENQLLEGEHRVTPPTTAPYAQRLLSARSHLAPFSFPQVRYLALYQTSNFSCAESNACLGSTQMNDFNVYLVGCLTPRLTFHFPVLGPTSPRSF